jgi:hypothetical protein
MRVYQKARVEIQGKKVRPLRTGHEEGKRESVQEMNAGAVDANGVRPGTEEKVEDDKRRRDSSGEREAKTSARSSVVDLEGGKLRRRSTVKLSFAGLADDDELTVGAAEEPMSMATMVKNFFT